MSFAPPPVQAAVAGALNPIEAAISSINTNTYLIGISMLLLNLGGRHLSLGLTPEQDRFFQNPWIRRGLLFVVIFVSTRNVFTAFWMTFGIILVLGYLFNEHSAFYLLGRPVPLPDPGPATVGLSTEETDIYRKLHDKVKRSEGVSKEEKPGAADLSDEAYGIYAENMKHYRTYF